jgi:hypothetical protein
MDRKQPADRGEQGDIAGFLASVDREVIELGVRDHLDVRRLLSSRPQWKPEDLRDAIAALLATDKDQLERIQRLFDLHIAARRAEPGRIARNDASASAPGPDKAGAPPTRLAIWLAKLGRLRVRRAAIAAALGLAIIAAILVAMSRLGGQDTPVEPAPKQPEAAPAPTTPAPAPAPTTPTPAPSASSTILRKARSIEYEHPGAPRDLDAWDGLVLALGALLLCLAVRWWMLPAGADKGFRQRLAARTERARAERRRLAQESAARGDPIRLSYNVPTYLPMRSQALDDTAVLLGRAGPREPVRDLDVGATVSATLRNAGRLVPVFEERRALRDTLVLIDEERGAHPWLAGFQRAMDYLERAGVPLRRYRFQHVPAWLTPEQGGPPIAIEELSRRFAGAHLLLFSRRLSPLAREGYARWIESMPEWPVRAWIDPDPRPLGERASEKRAIEMLVQLGVRRFPWSEEGLRAAALFLATEGERSPEPAWPDLPSITDPAVTEALRCWALCAALVPDADWDQLEAIRRHPDFAEIGGRLSEPAHLQRLLDWTAMQTGEDAESGDGRTLHLPNEAVDGMIREQRRNELAIPLDRTLEARARRLLIQQLEAERPDSELLRLRWMLKMASHKLVLEPKRSMALLEGFFGSAVEEEAQQIAAVEIERQAQGLALARCAMPSATIERLRALRGEGRWVEARELIRGHGRLHLAGALGASLLAIALGALFALGPAQWQDALLRSRRETRRATLPEIRMPQDKATSPKKGGAPE